MHTEDGISACPSVSPSALATAQAVLLRHSLHGPPGTPSHVSVSFRNSPKVPWLPAPPLLHSAAVPLLPGLALLLVLASQPVFSPQRCLRLPAPAAPSTAPPFLSQSLRFPLLRDERQGGALIPSSDLSTLYPSLTLHPLPSMAEPPLRMPFLQLPWEPPIISCPFSLYSFPCCLPLLSHGLGVCRNMWGIRIPNRSRGNFTSGCG